MGGSEKLAVHHGFPESGTANSQGARPAANSSLELLLLLLLLLDSTRCPYKKPKTRLERWGGSF